MFTVDVQFNEEPFKRKILEAAENQVREKLQMRGIHNVGVTAISIEGDSVRFSFSGEPEDIQKAKAALGYQL